MTSGRPIQRPGVPHNCSVKCPECGARVFPTTDGHCPNSRVPPRVETAKAQLNVAEWLESLELGQYAESFRQNAIDRDVLHMLSEDDLSKLGVELVGHRKRLLDAIARLEPERPERRWRWSWWIVFISVPMLLISRPFIHSFVRGLDASPEAKASIAGLLAGASLVIGALVGHEIGRYAKRMPKKKEKPKPATEEQIAAWLATIVFLIFLVAIVVLSCLQE